MKSETVTIYTADDGKEFRTEAACKNHEDCLAITEVLLTEAPNLFTHETAVVVAKILIKHFAIFINTVETHSNDHSAS